MDVQRVESVAVPTVLAGVVGGATGYLTKKAFDKEGKMTADLRKDMVDSFTKTKESFIKEADSLDALATEDLTDIKGIITRGLEKDNAIIARAYAEAKTPKEMNEVLKHAEANGINVNKYIKQATKENAKKSNKLFKFVKRNFKLLGVDRAKGQSKNDAIVEYLSTRDAKDVKADFNNAIEREKLEGYNASKYIRNLFNKVYDKETKGFKKDEASKEIVDSFKSAGRRMKLKQAGKFAGIASGIALVSSLISSGVHNFYRNHYDLSYRAKMYEEAFTK